MSLQALWWRSFFSCTKQLPQPPLPLWRGRTRGSDQPGWGAQGSDYPCSLLSCPHSAPGCPQKPPTSLSPWDPARLSRRALGKWVAGEHGVLLGVIPAGAGKGAVMGFCRG